MLSIDKIVPADLVCRLSILFVEDDAEVCETMSRYLERRVAKVYTAQSGESGLSSFIEVRPDLVISDIRMGGMDGLAMCRAIRNIEPDFPVIIVSAHNESDVLLSSMDLGISKYIVKPVDMKVLMDSIASIASSLWQQPRPANRLQNTRLMLTEQDYECESVKSYVARYLNTDHRDNPENIRSYNIPKLGVSADFFSFAKHGEDLYVMLADGAGYGLASVIPALQMPRIFQQQAARGFSLLSIAAELNRSLHEQNFVEHFVATTLVRINAHERFVEVLNCSNPPVLIFEENGSLPHTCHSKSTALGVVSDQKFSPETEFFNMQQNARIYLFTDGLAHALHTNVADFYRNELHDLFGHAPPEHVFDNVVSKIEKATRQFKADDVTLLEIRFECDEQAATEIESAVDPDFYVDADIPVELGQVSMLYVEDNDMARDYLARFLNRRLGMVHIARDGREGLSLFNKHRPQIVLTDIKMPLMNGFEMARMIRKLNNEVPIIMTSGSGNFEDAEKMFEIGISRFHMKPLDPGMLIKTIQSCIRQVDALKQMRLSSMVFNNSPIAVLGVGPDKRIVEANSAFCRITGYAPGEIIGRSPMLFCAVKQSTNIPQSIWRAVETDGGWSGEMQCQYKNGEKQARWLSVNATKGSKNEVTGYHFIFSDSCDRQLKQHDSLTRLPNREMFAGRSIELLAQGKQHNSRMALLYINIDRFNEINNVLGISGGDQVLFAVAQRLQANAGNINAVCRMGGDEFAILIPGDGGRESVEFAVKELHRIICRAINVESHEIRIQASIGIGSYPGDGETYEELLKSACSAMSQAKLAGGDTYRFFDKSISQREERHAILQQGIQAGLKSNEFYMLYQPKYSLSQQRVVGAEALVRWFHPTLGLISPVEFIPLAESSGTVVDMSEWIIETVCAQLAEWISLGLTQVPVSINISPVHFWRGDLVGSLQNGLQKWGLSPAMMPIEVTEGVVMDTSERTLQVLAQLKAIGFNLSIDDFGTGYSSLKYLKDLPIGEIKIDRSFIVEIPEIGQQHDLSRTAIPRAIIQLASEMNMAVVAEGVETENQKKFLLDNGCDVIQGYLFSRPVVADEFAVMLSGVKNDHSK